MVFYRITLQRSVIGTPQKTRAVVKSLGLGKRGSVAYQPATPSIAGAVAQIKELVSVELADKALSKAEQRELRKSNPGFTVEKRV
ncbi:mitochondrial 54S ribosomal protein uL30m [Kluyveromyces lactis]|uniref:Large ribosomal subunit protein uL30m n=1 Tax=Kluyveromyces lactis (strain ATCC 8585 / CBS 2359 / DSM 70799 / NBRC 1267 / NRRL Y-1140 / WM37) TaxID=284590 RepID=Q6CUB2_KLULA|nr:mitochondrial 54S ribosomal protein YmL33 [Kluyveromyces lactis]CAH01328.1 KLLA0C06270p [Kluyveromyces lactis]|eukprot:XP_452477.1 mitochondrial 54S ribosomal protein YmL33 [Kluyveromyces lactis]